MEKRTEKLSLGVVRALALVFLAGTLFTGFVYGDGADSVYWKIRRESPKFEVEEQTVMYQSGGMNIICTLTTPKTSRSRPIILLLHGFGGERHGFPVKNTTYGYHDRFAQILAEQGFCVLRPDFRGSGETGGGFQLTTVTGQKADTLAALDFIATLPDPVNPNIIGLAGHSQGGWVAAISAVGEKRIKSMVLLAAVSHPAHDFEGFMKKDGIKKGIATPWDQSITLPLYVEDVYIGDFTLKGQFFVELFRVSPLVAIRDYKNPLMYVSPANDIIVWPQPHVGQVFLDYHDGVEKLVTVNSDHNFDYGVGTAVVDETGYWMAAWFMETLKGDK